MGAIGIALLTKHFMEEKRKTNPELQTSFIGLETAKTFSWDNKPGQICQYCTNHCSRTIVTFSDGTSFVTGNRCERGEVTSDPNDPETKKLVAEIHKKMLSVPDMIKRTNQLLVKDYAPAQLIPQSGRRLVFQEHSNTGLVSPSGRHSSLLLDITLLLANKVITKLFEKRLT